MSAKIPEPEGYAWVTPAGTRVVLTPFDEIPMGVFEDADEMREPRLTYFVLKHATDEAGYEALRAAPMKAVRAMFTEWIKDAGVTLGES